MPSEVKLSTQEIVLFDFTAFVRTVFPASVRD